MKQNSKNIFPLLAFFALLFLFAAKDAEASFIFQAPKYIGLQNGLVGYWSFDGKDFANTTALDRIGGKNGIVYGGAKVVAGKIGQALSFDGSNDYVAASGGNAGAPTFIQEAETTWSQQAGQTKTTGSFTVQAGDVLVAYGMGENETVTLSVSGGSLTWTLQQSIVLTGFATMYVWTATVDTNKSMTVTVSKMDAVSIVSFGVNVLTFRGSDGIGASSKENGTDAGSGTEPSLNLTTTQANSAIVVANADWNAGDGTSRTWRTGAGTLTEQTYSLVTGAVTVYGGYHANAGAIGTYAVGLSAPVSQKYSIGAVEVKGSSGLNVGNIKTVSFWIKPNSTTQSIIDMDGTKNIDISSGTVRANNFTSPTIYIDGTEKTIFPDTNWHYVTVTTDTAVNASAFYIGKISTNYFNGQIDDVRLYSRALTASEIKRIYKIGGTFTPNSTINNDSLRNGLVGYWSFDGSSVSSTKAQDLSGGRNDGMLTNGLKQTIGKIGQALSFDGVNDYLNFTGIASYGDTTNGSSTDNTDGWMLCYRAGAFQGPTGSTISSGSWRGAYTSSATKTVWLGLYSDGAGVPGSQLDMISTAVPMTTTMTTFTITGTGTYQLVNGTVYWICASSDAGAGLKTKVTSPASSDSSAKTGTGALPATWTEDVNPNFDVSAYFNYSYSSAPSLTAETVSFWMKAATSTTQKIMDLNGTASISDSSGTITATNFTNPTIYVDGNITSNVSDTSWHHVVVTTGTSITANAIKMGAIGAMYYGGLIDDVRIYNRVLSQNEVRRLYRIGGTFKINSQISNDSLAKGLVGLWTFDGGSPGIDKSGNNNNGTLTNGPKTTIGKIGQALNFDGSNDYVISSVTPPPSNITVSFWIKTQSKSNGVMYFANGALDVTVYDRQIYIDSSGRIKARWWNSNLTNNLQGWLTGNTSITNNLWHHIVIINNTVNGKTIYLDGVLDGSDSTVYTGYNGYATPKLHFGVSRNDQDFGSDYLNGKLDDVRIYNRALSAQEIQRLYNLGR